MTRSLRFVMKLLIYRSLFASLLSHRRRGVGGGRMVREDDGGWVVGGGGASTRQNRCELLFCCWCLNMVVQSESEAEVSEGKAKLVVRHRRYPLPATWFCLGFPFHGPPQFVLHFSRLLLLLCRRSSHGRAAERRACLMSAPLSWFGSRAVPPFLISLPKQWNICCQLLHVSVCHVLPRPPRPTLLHHHLTTSPHSPRKHCQHYIYMYIYI